MTKNWSLVAEGSVLIAVAAIAYWAAATAVKSHEYELTITAYLNCVTKYTAAKASGKFPAGLDMPSSSEVCGKYK